MNTVSKKSNSGQRKKMFEQEIRKKEIEAIKKKYFDSKLIIPEDNIIELADVSWQEDRHTLGDVIGYILVNNSQSQDREFIFAYSDYGLNLTRKKGFRQLTAFPDLEKVYIARGNIFPSFLTKLPQRTREDLRREAKDADEAELLIKYSGVLTDDIILLPPMYLQRNNPRVKIEPINTKNGVRFKRERDIEELI